MSSGASIPPVPPGGAKPAGPQGQVVQIVSLPDGLKNMAGAMRLEGEVVGQNTDGSTRIKTPEGNIDVMIRGRQPQQGARIEIDIPPGSPPRNATMRAPTQASAPPQTQPQSQAPQTPLPQTPPAQGQAPAQPAPPVQTPPQQPATPQAPVDSVDVSQRPAPSPQPAPTPPVTGQPQTPQPPVAGQPAIGQTPAPMPVPQLPPLTPGQTITLTPLPPESVKDGGPVPNSATQPSGTGTNVQTSNVKAPGMIISTLINAVRTVLPASIPLPGLQTPATQTTAQPAQGAPVQTGLPPVMIMPLQAKVMSLVLPSGQAMTISAPDSAPVAPTPGQSTFPAPPPTTPGQQPAITVPGTAIMPALPAITVTVTQVTPQGLPVLPIPVDTSGAVQGFVLQTPPASAPVGTQITLQPIQLANANSITPQISPSILPAQMTPVPAPAVPGVATPSLQGVPPAWRAALPLMQPASIWPVMDELFQSFYQATPQAAQILGRVIPSPANPASFGPSVLLFAAALKSGELQGWMGEKKLDMIHKLGKADIVSRLTSETAQLSANTDAAPMEWKSLPIPMLWQNEISKVLFHVRREPPEDERDQGEDGTRFMLDLSLTRMGEVQLDGIVRGQRLDLILRTQMPVSESMQEAMKKAYADALDGSNIYGELGFQGDLKQWVHVLSREDVVTASV